MMGSTPIALAFLFQRFQGQTVVLMMGVKLIHCTVFAQHLHKAGLCQRDVRPENVLVTGGDVCLPH
jgi:serine/threonine protein kinase